jgi:hypothetical protein
MGSVVDSLHPFPRMEVTGPVPTTSWEKMSPLLNNATFMCSNLQGVFAHGNLEPVLGLGGMTASGRVLLERIECETFVGRHPSDPHALQRAFKL